MSRQQDSKSQQPSKSPMDGENEDFNFDQWAGAVKRQMIASLKRRGSV